MLEHQEQEPQTSGDTSSASKRKKEFGSHLLRSQHSTPSKKGSKKEG